jgi:soluble lytic murein transglycosylase-like protein
MLKPTIAACLVTLTLASAVGAETPERARINDAVKRYAAQHGVPESLIHRVIKRESGYRPHAHNRLYYGLMQISYATAKSMGYKGDARGLFDIDTNLTYAVPYLANAWRLANGSEQRAVQLYASGYYYHAKAKGIHNNLRTAQSPSLVKQPEMTAYAAVEDVQQPAGLGGFFSALFSQPVERELND